MSRIALWKKSSKNGNAYFEGNIQDGNRKVENYILLFKNNKTKDNQPDYRLYKKLSKELTTDENKGMELLVSLWKKSTKNGEIYLSGYDKNTNMGYAIFSNFNEDGLNKPILSGECKIVESSKTEVTPATNELPFEI